MTKIYNKFTEMFQPEKWPPNWAHVQPKKGPPKYRHEVTVASSERADYAYTLYFTSEKKARSFMNAAKESTNDVQTEYERKELPTFNEERIET